MLRRRQSQREVEILLVCQTRNLLIESISCLTLLLRYSELTFFILPDVINANLGAERGKDATLCFVNNRLER